MSLYLTGIFRTVRIHLLVKYDAKVDVLSIQNVPIMKNIIAC